jgi:hypothetical protein
MKLVLNADTGEINIQLENDEEYFIEQHLDGLTKFVCEESVKVHTLTKLLQKFTERVEISEKTLSELNQQLKSG